MGALPPWRGAEVEHPLAGLRIEKEDGDRLHRFLQVEEAEPVFKGSSHTLPSYQKEVTRPGKPAQLEPLP
jgi:hypothetical protein